MCLIKKVSSSRKWILPILILLSFYIAGCGTLNNGRGWGQDAIYPVDLKRVGRAAHNAFFDLQTLVPAIGALIFTIDDWDEKASDWAIDHNPVFGSIEDAVDASDAINTFLMAETVITTLATPSGDDPKTWAYSKFKGACVEIAANKAATRTTSYLKKKVGRKRPDESNDKSFPSGHATKAFSLSTLSNRNLDSIHMNKYLKRSLQTTNILLATGTAWARVEGHRHYPSDVLAGSALSHFLIAFIHDAFMGLPEDNKFDFVILPRKKGAEFKFTIQF